MTPSPITSTVFKGSKAGHIVKDTVKLELSANDVSIKITHSGVCGTDLHHLSHDIVLGHEGVGVVEAVGATVKNFKV